MQELSPQQKKKAEKFANLIEFGNQKDLEILDTLINIEDKITALDLTEVIQAIKNISPIAEKELETQKVEVTNFPKFPEQKAPIVTVTAPEVTVDAPIINIDNTGVESEIAKITALLDKPEELEETKIIDEDGKVVDFKGLFKRLGEHIGNIRVGGASVTIPSNLPVTITGQAIYAIQIDDVSTTSVTYIGKAPIGSATSSAVWQVQKLDQSGTPITSVITWAGTGGFNQIWSDRTSLTYT